MPFGISRKGVDLAGGIGIEGSSNVRANGAPVMRNGDRVAGHGEPPHSPPPPMIAACNKVYVNGILVVRKENVATCGDKITGSTNVRVGA